MNTHICFRREIRKYYANTPSYQELCTITRKTHLKLAKAGLTNRVVLFTSGLNSGIYCITLNSLWNGYPMFHQNIN